VFVVVISQAKLWFEVKMQESSEERKKKVSVPM